MSLLLNPGCLDSTGAVTNLSCPDFTLVTVIPKCHEQEAFRSFLIAIPLYVLLKEGQGF